MSAGPLPLSLLDERPAAFARMLSEQLETASCAIISGHDVPQAAIAACQEVFQAFFALPEAEKLACHRPGWRGQRGYTPLDREQPASGAPADHKEFFHTGRPETGGRTPIDPRLENVWPGGLPRLRPAAEALFGHLEQLGLRLLEALAHSLAESAGYFLRSASAGNNVLRVTHYPPAPAPGAARTGEIEDVNLLTLLCAGPELGLELLGKDDQWRAVNPPAGSIIVTCGDMLQRATNDYLPSATHRVRPPGAEAVMDMAFYLHFNPDHPIATLPSCVTPERPDRYPEPVAAQLFVEERLTQFKLD